MITISIGLGLYIVFTTTVVGGLTGMKLTLEEVREIL